MKKLKPVLRKKRRLPRRFELKNLRAYSLRTFSKLLAGKIKPKRTTRVEELLIPVSNQIYRRFIEDKSYIRVNYIMRHYKDFTTSQLSPVKQTWDLINAKGFSFVLSLPLLFKYSEYRQGYAKIIHIIYEAMKKCAESPINTVIKLELLKRKIILIRTESSIQLRTTSTWAIWNISPWWGVQLALLIVNLYPITFNGTRKPLNVKWNLFWFWPQLKFLSVLPIIYDKTPQIFIEFCKEKRLIPKFGVLFYLINKFLDGDYQNQKYYDLLQYILLNYRNPEVLTHTNINQAEPFVFGHWDPFPPKLILYHNINIPIPFPHKKEEQVLVHITYDAK